MYEMGISKRGLIVIYVIVKIMIWAMIFNGGIVLRW